MLGRGPARRRGSGGGKPVRRMPGWWETSVRRSGVDGRDEWRVGEKNSVGGRRLYFKGGIRILNSTRKGNSDLFHDSLNPKFYF
jgi:hypothetical protein